VIDTILEFAAWAAPLIVTIGFLCAIAAFVIILASCIWTEIEAARREDQLEQSARSARIVEGDAARAARPHGCRPDVLPIARRRS